MSKSIEVRPECITVINPWASLKILILGTLGIHKLVALDYNVQEFIEIKKFQKIVDTVEIR